MDTRWQALSYAYGLKLIVQLFVSANYRTNYQMKKILWTTLSFFNWKIVSTYLLTTHLLIRTAYFLHKLDNFSISRVGTQWYSLKMICFFFLNDSLMMKFNLWKFCKLRASFYTEIFTNSINQRKLYQVSLSAANKLGRFKPSGLIN